MCNGRLDACDVLIEAGADMGAACEVRVAIHFVRGPSASVLDSCFYIRVGLSAKTLAREHCLCDIVFKMFNCERKPQLATGAL